jgi:hypothetical protein
MSTTAYVGDVGRVLRLQTRQDLTTAVVATTEVRLKPPDPSAATKVRTGTAERVSINATNVTDGWIEYTTIGADFDEAGAWQVQARVTFSDGDQIATAIADLKVEVLI